jgi:spore maturation protein CgeB
LAALARDPEQRAELARHGLETIRARHTCGHRVDELIAILRSLTARTHDRPSPAVLAGPITESSP